MTVRRFLFVSHRYCGLAAALFLLVAAVTGCLLVFRGELDAALNPELFRVAARPVLPATEVVRRVQQAHPDWRIRRFDLRTQPGWALHLEIEPRPGPAGIDQVFADPADGAVHGMRATRPGWRRRDLFQTIFLLHYTLLAGTAGRWCMGMVALLWMGLSGFGVAMTWPRRLPRMRNWIPAWLTRRGRLARRPLPELHRVAGLWLALPLLVLAGTSFAMNFYAELARPLVERLSPPRASPFDAAFRQPDAAPAGPPIGFAPAECIAMAAASGLPGMAPVEMTDDPAHGFYGVSFAPGGTSLYRGFGRVTYYVDRHSGRLAWIDRPGLDGTGRLVLRSLYPLHSGQVAGLATRLLVLLLGIVTCALAVTGFLPWWRRRHARRQGSGEADPAMPVHQHRAGLVDAYQLHYDAVPAHPADHVLQRRHRGHVPQMGVAQVDDDA